MLELLSQKWNSEALPLEPGYEYFLSKQPLSKLKVGEHQESVDFTNDLAKLQYFTTLDFPELRGFLLLNHHLGVKSRVRSL